MLIAATIISIYSIYQYLWGYQHTIEHLKKIGSDFLLTSSYARDILLAKRAIGTFPSPNILAGYLTMIFFFSLSLRGTVTKSSLRSNLIYMCVPALIIASLTLTKSLGAWLSLIAALIILLITSYDSIKKQKILLLSSTVLIVIALTFILMSRWERLTNLANPQNSIIQRLNYWRTAIAVIKDHPILGVGPGNFQEVFLKYKIGLSTNTRYAHNIFLHTWAETGFLGLIALIYLISAFFIKAKSKSHYIFFAGLAFILHNLIDNTYFIPEASFLWWVLLAIAS
jgi:O-antigen ligase